jgi:hypothetical protein
LLLANSAQKTLAWGFEELATNARFIVVANFTGAQQTITSIPWLGSGTFYDAFDQSTIVVNGGNVPSMTIPAYTAKCYSSLPDGLLLDVKPTTTEVPIEYSLSQNYPNPFNPSTKIKFSIPSVGTGHAPSLLKVYDVLGREVATLVNENLAPGSYQAIFDARSLSSGIYFYRLQVGGFVETRKMIVAK